MMNRREAVQRKPPLTRVGADPAVQSGSAAASRPVRFGSRLASLRQRPGGSAPMHWATSTGEGD
jgi:hypothetical protein